MSPTPTTVADRRKLVLDPEIGLNIVDMGMVYGIEIGCGRVLSKLTMTTPACPMSRYSIVQADHVLSRIEGVEAVETELVWHPAWTRAMMDPQTTTLIR